jgi:hypothetical protein
MTKLDSQLEGAVRGMAKAFAAERQHLRDRLAVMEAEHRELVSGLRLEVTELRAERDRLVRELEAALPTRRLKAVP